LPQLTNDEEFEEIEVDDSIIIGAKLFSMSFSNNTIIRSPTTIASSAQSTTIANTGTISGMSIMSHGAGYSLPPSVTIGPSLGPSIFKPNVFGMITGQTGYIGSTSKTAPPNYQTIVNGDFILVGQDGTKINLGDALRALIEQTKTIIPDYKLIDKYPSLADAWEEYKSELHKNISSPELQSMLENYKMIASIVKASDVGEN
jgi:hypothetical protein